MSMSRYFDDTFDLEGELSPCKAIMLSKNISVGLGRANKNTRQGQEYSTSLL